MTLTFMIFPIISQPELKAGQLCLARFSLDKSWYRAYVEKLHGMQAAYDVFFVDYGNREKVKDGDVRLIDGRPHQQTLILLPPFPPPHPFPHHPPSPGFSPMLFTLFSFPT